MALALQKKRVDCNTDKGDRQSRSKIILQMRDLHAPADLPPKAFVTGTLNGASQLADIIPYACKR
jgi:hypothetical protein